MRKHTIRNRTLMIVYGIFLLIALVTICVANKNSTYEYSKDYADFSEGWVENGKEANIHELSDYKEITNTIPELKHDQTLFINFKSINADILIDGKYVYQHKDFNQVLFGKTEGTYFLNIDLYKEYSNKEIKIIVKAPYEDGRINKIYIGDELDLNLTFIRSQMIGGFTCVAIIFIGIILLFVSIPLVVSKRIGHKILYMGLFAITMGIYMLFDSRLLQLVYGNAKFFHVVAEIMMLLLMLPLMLYIGHTYKKSSNRTVIQYLSILALANFAINYSLNFFGIMDYHETIRFTHISYILGILYIFYVCIKSLFIADKREIVHTIGILTICSFILLDIALIYFSVSVESSLFTRLGVLIFVILEAVEYIIEYYSRYEKEKKSEFLRKLAYQDGLTELLNRTSFTEEMEKLKDKKDGVIAVFDVNDLKKVNDTYGHTEGDSLIIETARILKDSFNKFGKCYRIGGDEFVFISEDIIETEFEQCIKNFKKGIERYNKNSDKKYNISVAIGYELITSSTTYEDAFKKADNKMYVDKQNQKNKKKTKK